MRIPQLSTPSGAVYSGGTSPDSVAKPQLPVPEPCHRIEAERWASSLALDRKMLNFRHPAANELRLDTQTDKQTPLPLSARVSHHED
ncbi:hypothetical protein GCM10011577_18990 [Pseudarthrobacter polychromogenes]|uniref:Uncharacterized protein n=1 Tax=Pseudarthrobacter polychromogenes TaxID=1676 RepID=A0ABQ1XKB1_9MICC|nr:hypothetical protein GCM10011577_18990 [Pseudarthrobacter polychromogenes]